MEEIDIIIIKKRLHEVAEEFRHDQMRCEKLAASDDKILESHKDYWLSLAKRRKEQAECVDNLWKHI